MANFFQKLIARPLANRSFKRTEMIYSVSAVVLLSLYIDSSKDGGHTYRDGDEDDQAEEQEEQPQWVEEQHRPPDSGANGTAMPASPQSDSWWTGSDGRTCSGKLYNAKGAAVVAQFRGLCLRKNSAYWSRYAAANA